MSKLTMNTRIKLSVINGMVTGAIAAWFYANSATKNGDFWQAVHFHPLNYLAMILVCCCNTFAFFALLGLWAPIKGWKGFLLGGMVAVAGSFLCSLVMGIGTGKAGDLAGGKPAAHPGWQTALLPNKVAPCPSSLFQKKPSFTCLKPKR